MKPYNDYIVVDPSRQEKSPGGVVLPESVNPRFVKAIVVESQDRDGFPLKGEFVVYDSLGELETFKVAGQDVQVIYLKQLVVGL